MNRTLAAFPGLVGLLGLLAPSSGTAQESGELIVGGLAGGTYYCIEVRCNEGNLLGVTAGFFPGAVVMLEAGARRHGCFDCTRFWMYEGGVQFRYPRSGVQPFVAAGVHRMQDAGRFGKRTAGYVGVGAWLGSWSRFAFALEIRGRNFGSGDRMGEATVLVARRFGP